jgi:hypothetical protein
VVTGGRQTENKEITSNKTRSNNGVFGGLKTGLCGKNGLLRAGEKE